MYDQQLITNISCGEAFCIEGFSNLGLASEGWTALVIKLQGPKQVLILITLQVGTYLVRPKLIIQSTVGLKRNQNRNLPIARIPNQSKIEASRSFILVLPILAQKLQNI